jgi:hypothetical protein
MKPSAYEQRLLIIENQGTLAVSVILCVQEKASCFIKQSKEYCEKHGGTIVFLGSVVILTFFFASDVEALPNDPKNNPKNFRLKRRDFYETEETYVIDESPLDDPADDAKKPTKVKGSGSGWNFFYTSLNFLADLIRTYVKHNANSNVNPLDFRGIISRGNFESLVFEKLVSKGFSLMISYLVVEVLLKQENIKGLERVISLSGGYFRRVRMEYWMKFRLLRDPISIEKLMYSLTAAELDQLLMKLYPPIDSSGIAIYEMSAYERNKALLLLIFYRTLYVHRSSLMNVKTRNPSSNIKQFMIDGLVISICAILMLLLYHENFRLQIIDAIKKLKNAILEKACDSHEKELAQLQSQLIKLQLSHYRLESEHHRLLNLYLNLVKTTTGEDLYSKAKLSFKPN